MTFIKAGIMISLPYIAAAIGVVLGGCVSDTMLKHTGSANMARKLPIVSGMLLASTIILANYVPADNNALVIAIMSIAFFGQGMTNLGWTVVSDIAPKKLIGLTGGLFNFTTNLAGIITPIVIGAMYQRTGTFVGPLVYIAVVAVARRVRLQRHHRRHPSARDRDGVDVMAVERFSTSTRGRPTSNGPRSSTSGSGCASASGHRSRHAATGSISGISRCCTWCSGPTARPHHDGSGNVDHIAFEASDLEATRRALTEAGLPFREAVVPRDGTIQIFVRDPDGVMVELNFARR